MRIVYVGLKELKADNVSATGLVWTRGQVHEVEDAVKAAKLLEHPLIWADADKPYELLPQLAAVNQVPVAKFMPKDSPFIEPFVLTIPDDVVKQLHDKTLVPVFMSPVDADAFAVWKMDQTKQPDVADIEPSDKRTREWKDWAARNGKAA